MRRLARSIVVPTLAAALAAVSLAASAQDTPLDQLAWLAGCWRADNADAGSVEQWMPAAGGAMMGMSRTIRGGRTLSYEFMRIAPSAEGKLAFHAQPSGKPPETFIAVRQSADEVVFENLAHDFPQRVIYKLETPTKLAARIEGTRNGTTRAIPYPMTRMSCDAQAKP